MDGAGGIDRRGLIGGATALSVLAGSAARAQDRPRLFTDGPLARNHLAAQFHKVDNLVWPENMRMVDQRGRRADISQFRGKALVVSLWAEWCTPCLVEMPGMALMRRRIAGPTFDLLPVLTSTQFNYGSDAMPVMRRLGAEDLPCYLDNSGDRSRMAKTFTRESETDEGGIPCNLILDGQGRIRGRAIGGDIVRDTDGEKFTMWMTNHALQLCEALRDGVLS